MTFLLEFLVRYIFDHNYYRNNKVFMNVTFRVHIEKKNGNLKNYKYLNK